jgi:hydrogenase nickel incorporation protein HypB
MEVRILKDVLKANDSIAETNRKLFDLNRVLAINIVSSPGSGKTTTLEKTVELLKGDSTVGVIEGDVATSKDAERLMALDVDVVQINTERFGGGCHLDANLVSSALGSFDLEKTDYMFVENIGNLICPTGFYLGEHKFAAILSVTEGEDKPLKYPAAFQKASVCLINKIDLIKMGLEVDMKSLRENITKINPSCEQIELSARTGEGMKRWIEWLENCRTEAFGG